MNESILLYLMGGVFALAGTLMILFRQSWGVAFCRWGKADFRRCPDRLKQWFGVDEIYNEADAPRIFLWLGIVFIIQSPAFFVIGYLW